MNIDNKNTKKITLTLAETTLNIKNQSQTKKKIYSTGKRKAAVARVWVKVGKGDIKINGKELSKYFVRQKYINSILYPLNVLNLSDRYDVFTTVKGGGLTGQAESVMHGISRALGKISEEFHQKLSHIGLLTRDSRIVERKKYGQHKARKSTQFSKR